MLRLSAADEQTLLRQARQALEEAVRHHRLSEIEPPPPGPLQEKCGAFVTLHKNRRLRGCIGYIEPHRALYQTVRECALAAALHDRRFDPVTSDELHEIHLEISVLSPLEELSPDQIEVGRHGVLVSQGFHKGLLLPQVAVEWKWDRERFLDEACLKAGLPPNAWRHGAKIQAFTARVFGEPLEEARTTHHAA